jgi:RNase adapter protein RapZ
MRLIIVSGLSGSGKSVALHVLEDIGYYCIDNMPAALLQAVIGEVMKGTEPEAQLLAVGVDARNRPRDIEALPGLLGELRGQGIEAELLFLQASDEVLLKRYRDSRRRHPLATRGTALHAAIARERDVLSAIINAADLVIDTSSTSIYELADAVRERVDRRKFKSLSVLIESFGFREGIPADADFVFDLRSLPNPYWTVELRGLTGLDREVAEFLDGQERFVAMYEDILGFLKRWIPQYETVNRGYLTVAIGCTGGQHRSVWMTEKLAAALRDIHDPVLTRHNRLHRKTLSDQQSP